MSTNRTLNPTSHPITPGVKPMSIGKCLTLAAATTIGVGTALGLTVFERSLLPASAAPIVASAPQQAGTIQLVTASARVPGSTAFEAGPCEPIHGGNPGRLQPFVSAPPNCDPGSTAGGTVSGPGGGGTGESGENPGPVETGNGPGDPNTPPSEGPSGGGGGNCIGDEIECHQPF
jgi:hypothetical protein